VTIRLRVTGGRDRALDLFRNLEQSKHFAQPRLAAETLATANGAPGQMQAINTNGDVNFDILADYRPLPLPVNAKSGEEKTAAEKPEDAGKPALPAKQHGLGVKRLRVPVGVARPGRAPQQ
jgi:type IV pilus assembly protein PilN